MKNKITLLFWLLLPCFFLSVKVLADQSQFYFTAKSAPMGASSKTGKGSNGVYLRWDIVEGALPDDIVRFELKRDGVILLQKNMNELMPQTNIHEMYSGAAEQQRLLQTITLLKKITLAEKQNFDASNFPAELYKRFTSFNDKAWVFLASRQNFNIARARYRAFLDTTASGTVTYTLNVFNALGNVAQMGKVTVDTLKNAYQILPVTDFQQLKKSQCDITEAMADHNTVLLYWQPPGNNILTGQTQNLTDKTASALQTAGYQIYRNTTNLDSSTIQAPPRNIALEASKAAHDQRGNLQLIGLERVNNLLVIAEGNIVNNKKQAAYIETPQHIISAGLNPGDKRAYYIVAVDFAGHLGETVGTLVQVPNRLMPATPWNIRFSQNMGDASRASLEWDASTLENYTAHYSFSRVICNAADVKTSNKVEYAANIEACNKPITTRIDVANYLVYRFDSAHQANHFADSDGDGYANVDEKTLGSDACNIENKPGSGSPAKSFLTSRISSTDMPRVIALQDNRSVVRFTDNFLTRSENIGKTFWYRIASITADGNVSPLSATFPVVFWDNTLPPKPTVTSVTQCCEIIPVYDPTVGGSVAKGDWGFTDNVGLYSDISLSISNQENIQTGPFSTAEFNDVNSSMCRVGLGINYTGKRPNRVLTYPGVQPGSTEASYCRVAIPENMDLCKAGGWQLSQSSCQKAVSDGDIIDGYFTTTISATEPGACLVFMKKIGIQYTRAYSTCGTNATELVIELKGGECGFAQQQDASGNLSPMAEIPCTTAASVSPPGPPQITSFSATENSATFDWRLPLEPVAITLIEISSDVNESAAVESDKQLISIANAGFNPAKLFTDSSAIHALIGARDQWCIRMKSIAPSQQDLPQVLSSAWSSRLCSTRRSGSNLNTQYMPWPKQDVVTVQQEFVVISANTLLDAQPGMAYEKMPIIIPFALPANQLFKCTLLGRTANYDEVNPVTSKADLLFARGVVCPNLTGIDNLQQRKMVDMPFIVYRQARTPQGEVGKWVQVSPLINKIYWQHETVAGSTASRWVFKDPYFKFYKFAPTASWMLSYVDRYPHIAGYEYRYQIVSFNKQHAIQKIYLSATQNGNWVRAAELGAR